MKPKISILTSVYNCKKFIKGFLESMVKQTIWDQCELICIDVSTDGETQIIDEFMLDHPNIVKIVPEKDDGLYACWNLGIGHSKGDYLINANTDDRQLPSSMETLSNALDNNPDVDLVYGDLLVTTIPNEPAEECKSKLKWPCFDHSVSHLFYHNSPHCQPMWRKDIHNKYGYFDTNYRISADSDMWLRAAVRGSKFLYVKKLVGVYFDNPEGISSKRGHEREAVTEVFLMRAANIKEMKKVISFSLWGSKPQYCVGAIKNVILAQTVYPDWVCRFYIDNQVPQRYIDEILSIDNRTEIIKKDVVGDWNALLWRFVAIDDDDVGIMISRDADSRLGYREKAAVNDWLESWHQWHIMRDHPHHNFPVLGGMWGVKKGGIVGMQLLIDHWPKRNEYGTDYKLLETIYKAIHKKAMVHDPYFEKLDFPTERKHGEYVGQIYDERDKKLLSNFA